MIEDQAIYDRHADVLYVSLEVPRPAYVEEGADGILWRFAEADDMPCGVTVLGFRAIWTGREAQLAGTIGVFLRADADHVEAEIRSAVFREIAA